MTRGEIKSGLLALATQFPLFSEESELILEVIKALEQEPKTGHWEKTTDEYCYWYKCSRCGTKAPKNEWGNDYFSPYCPECGIKIVEAQERSECI